MFRKYAGEYICAGTNETRSGASGSKKDNFPAKLIMKITSVVLLTATIIFAGCSGAKLLTGDWSSNLITVDGNDTDWKGTSMTEVGRDLRVGVRSDSQFVWIMLTTVKRDLAQQFLRGGFVVWFDPEGKEDKAFGIRFPSLGDRRSASIQDDLERTPGATDRRLPGSDDPARNRARREANAFELLNNGSNQGVRLSLAEARGILLRMSEERDLFVYEMQIPLRTSDAFPFGVNPTDSLVSVGIETAAATQRQPRPRIDEDPAFGPPPGGPMGGPPPGMRVEYMGGASSSNLIKEWVTVRLARTPR